MDKLQSLPVVSFLYSPPFFVDQREKVTKALANLIVTTNPSRIKEINVQKTTPIAVPEGKILEEKSVTDTIESKEKEQANANSDWDLQLSIIGSWCDLFLRDLAQAVRKCFDKGCSVVKHSDTDGSGNLGDENSVDDSKQKNKEKLNPSIIRVESGTERHVYLDHPDLEYLTIAFIREQPISKWPLRITGDPAKGAYFRVVDRVSFTVEDIPNMTPCVVSNSFDIIASINQSQSDSCLISVAPFTTERLEVAFFTCELLIQLAKLPQV